MSKIENNRSMLFCEICGFKKIIESQENIDFFEIKTTPVQTRLPTIDSITGVPININKNDAKNKNTKLQSKKYKCPKCGRAIKLRNIIKPFEDAIKKIEKENAKIQEEENRKKRIEDGKLPEKKIDSDFIG